MRKYELFLVLPGTLDENQAASRSKEVLEMVKEKDSKAELDDIGKNRLAYPIKQIRYGYFYTITFECEPQDMLALQNKLGLQRDLLRAIISLFNAKVDINKKLTYNSSEVGNNNNSAVAETEEAVEEKEEEKVEKPVKKVEKTEKVKSTKKVNLEDINKKLDEILDEDITSGV